MLCPAGPGVTWEDLTSDMWASTSCLLPRNFSNFATWNSPVNSLCTQRHTTSIVEELTPAPPNWWRELGSWCINAPLFVLRVHSSEIHFIRLLKGAHGSKSLSAWVVVKSGTHPCITCLSFPISHTCLSSLFPEISSQIHSSFCLRLYFREKQG